ncbi:stalk domain-containing protein [Brevibacillus dissolubilis]|uniref:stalk domain-containing protein n=1 Tax=Brevibacillus dissolubilis TaxID=1844116 RepID=UPI0011177B6A|nr:stalk domain-containing protein [Brevibacillus dissolubilis]
MIGKKKILSVLALATLPLIGVGMTPASTDAAVATKNVQVKYNNVKVMYNGGLVSTDIEPFLINGTTYIPVRMMAGVFNKDVAWDGTTSTVKVNDKVDTRIANLESQIAALKAEIANKDSKIRSLEDEIADYEEDEDDNDYEDDIDDLEDDLNDSYSDYADLEWSIYVSGDEDDIDVEIEIDLDEYEDDFEDLDTSDIEELVESVTEDVWDVFEDADVHGVIIDSAEDDELHEFEGYADDGTIELDDDEI